MKCTIIIIQSIFLCMSLYLILVVCVYVCVCGEGSNN